MTREQIKAEIARSEAADSNRPYTGGPHEHVDSGWRCLLDHGADGQCFKCSICGEWIGKGN